MPANTFWKGYLKFSLVTCPVAMTPAVSDSERIRFHLINAKTGNRLVSQYRDSETGAIVNKDDQVSAFRASETEYVPVENEDLDAIRLESQRTIEIEHFVDNNSIDQVWFNRPHYVTPNDKVGEEAYCVIRDAMAATKTVGIARIVLYRREQAVVLQPLDNGLLLWTLHFGNEVRSADDYFPDRKTQKVNSETVSLIAQLIEKKKTPWKPAFLVDPVQNKTAQLIEERSKKTKKSQKTKNPTDASNVINIMNALKKSIAADKAKKNR